MKKSFLPYVLVLNLSYFSAELYYILGNYGYLAFDEMTYKAWVVGSLLLYNPLLIFLLSLVYALLNGFSLKYLFAAVFSFLPFLALTIGVLIRKGWKKFRC